MKDMKESIRKAFSKGAANYDRFANLQLEVAEELLYFMDRSIPCKTILDVGCGTGFLTLGLQRAFSDSHIIGCDFSHAMATRAASKFLKYDDNVFFLTGDGEELPFRGGVFDLVASNLTYQWACDLKQALFEAYRVLRGGGSFVFSTLGKKSLDELRESYRIACKVSKRDGLPPFIVFKDKDDIYSLMRQTGFKTINIASFSKIRTYPDMWRLLKTLKNIGAGNPLPSRNSTLGLRRLLREMAETYGRRFKVQDSNHVYATYEVIFVYGKK